MDVLSALQRAGNNYVSGGRIAIGELVDLLSHPSTWWAKFQDVDPRLGGPMILVFTLVVAFVSMVVMANIFEAPSASKTEATAVARDGSPALPPPTEVVSLRVYPIKSCRGFEISSTRLRKSGLSLDRNWMFISLADRKFLTIRGDPTMTLIDTTIVDDAATKEQMLQVSIHGQPAERVAVPAFPSETWLKQNTTLSKVEIWEEETDAWQYGDHINDMFNRFFSKPVALVYKGPTSRMVGVNGREELYGSATPHHFADVMSLQIASEASIADLNRRLAEKARANGSDGDGDGKPTARDLTIERFRPNIIVRGRDSAPWEEDTWKRIRLTTTIPEEEAMYKIDLDVVARCARCQVPNVNPDTAEKHAREPWDELMKFRRVDTGGPAKWKPCFGMLALPRSEGKLRVGAKLEVLETTDKHLYNTRKFADL